MTWKSTAFVSGAGLLATWLASVPSPQTTLTLTTARTEPARPTVRVESEIATEADRLERRNRADEAFHASSRNLFRFAPARQSARIARAPEPPAVTEVAEALPPTPPVHVSGVAMDRVDDRDVWTAILSTPAGLLLLHEGEQVVPGWTVSSIGAESVGLTRPDGSILTIPLGK